MSEVGAALMGDTARKTYGEENLIFALHSDNLNSYTRSFTIMKIIQREELSPLITPPAVGEAEF